MLRPAGLSVAEEATYLALVRQGAATPAQLTVRTGLTPAQVRRAVLTLRRRGFVHHTPAPDERVVPVPPELAVEQQVRRREEELEGVRAAARRLAEEARSRATNRRTEELIEIVSGRAAVAQAFDRLQHTARQQMRVLVAPPYAVPKAVNRQQLERQAAGVTYRAVYDVDALTDAAFLESVVVHVQEGEHARLAHGLPTKLAVADRELALLPLAWTRAAHDAALLVHPCGLLDALIALFETVWNQATPLSVGDSAGLTAATTVSAADRHLLSLLVAGLTDEAVGARLGVSRRTVVRRVQHLMELTNSRSRMQLGWQARERGWL
ncbi:TrmB family transcriptional regulator [Micromonospora globbae]|uniref:TrmB family transcriptional regulator n=1 Tax=Micromonospora globbae TaxID=1894969 RepID=UPI00378D437D